MVTTRQRPEAFAWSPSGVDFKGAIVGDYAHYFDPNATNNQSRLEFLTIDDILRKPSEDSSFQHSLTCEYRFNELSWSPLRTDLHPSGLVFGGTENGTVVFFDAQAFVTNNSLSIVSSRRDHQGHVLSVDHSADNRWAISVGGAAQLLLWDLTNLATPFSPGVSNFTDQEGRFEIVSVGVYHSFFSLTCVFGLWGLHSCKIFVIEGGGSQIVFQVKKVRWNRSMDNILVSLSAHRGSLWDMRRPGGPVLEFAEGAIVGDYAHYFDPNATNNQSRLEFLTIDDILRKPSEDSSFQHSLTCEYRFNELSWSPLRTDLHPSGLVFGGTENGTVVKKVRWNRSMDNILVSLSAHRGSLWDMRRPGGPVLEFAEIGSGCDWADICWKPADSTTMILCNQLAATPGIQKWDLRYPTAPVGEFYIHDRGVTAMDW
ncbi:unnamed protein product [Strongylus vulgaris]|uniref:Peroxin-7 n=1 Tax=Strongylus vulgaris TaxID=40348 RepID=A0A3P7IT84_STRVU|nr:unnamed protein product [Strongylus vulgaris]